jgi:hypothetical protein
MRNMLRNVLQRGSGASQIRQSALSPVPISYSFRGHNRPSCGNRQRTKRAQSGRGTMGAYAKIGVWLAKMRAHRARALCKDYV